MSIIRRLYRPLLTVRVRITLATTIVAGFAMAGGGIGLVAFHRHALTDNVNATVRLRADDVAAQLAAGAAPESLTASDDEIAVVQILDGAGAIVAASPNIRGEPPATALRPNGSQRVLRSEHLAIDEDDAFRVSARTAAGPAGPYVVIVAGSLEDVNESTGELASIVKWGVPLLLAFIAGVTWVAVGRALSPMEGMRREAAAITDRDLGRRLPEPHVDDEVGRLARTLNAMLDRLQAAYAAQERFVADAAHELRSPLASLKTQIEVAASVAEADERETLDGLLAETERLHRLADDLLLLARGADGGGSEAWPVLDLDDIVLEEVRRFPWRTGVSAGVANVSAAAVRGDASQLARLIRNLLANANRHADGQVHVTLSEHGPRAVLTVEDDGDGIPEGERERVFERFTRLDAGRGRDGGGSGLGLAIVRAIVTAHGGSVIAGDALPKGASFRVELPGASG